MMCFGRKKYKMTDEEYEKLITMYTREETDKYGTPDDLFKELKNFLDNEKIKKMKNKIKNLFKKQL